MLTDFLYAFVLILAAEFGDKSQLLALSLTARYKVRQVLAGLAIGIPLNHSLAILLGYYLSDWLAGPWFMRGMGLVFIGFGIWTWREAKQSATESTRPVRTGYNAVLTVALAFFLVEMGDKTQLAAGTLGATLDFPLLVLAGTSLAVVLLNAVVVIAGQRVYRRFPVHNVKIAAAFLFFATGVWILVETLL